MASYWKSQPRKFCEVCKCWIGDNKASIDFHERGKSHQAKKERQIEQIKKNSKQQHATNQRADGYLKRMESAAIQQYRKDLELQGLKLPAHLEPKKPQPLPQTSAASTDHLIAKPKKRKIQDTVAHVNPVTTNTFKPPPKSSTFKSSSSKSSHPYGSWETVEKEEPEPTYEYEAPVFVKEVPPKIEFEEKTVVAASDDAVFEVVAFKKRKTNVKKSRNMRKKDDS
uniref:Zinc finger protein n=2 Tax=Ciona intestinalis TaxID=7719 RepID=Q1RLB2_CIOIN|nr:Zn-finger (U1-like)-1 [Ciona intestinalis]FAA00153.1 TPA: zinc finger protein [Ciona intestinalis]|eukprot:NP_001122366.1 Zn-finger (U1-like)-1 [Ciona intestinalis]